MSSELLGKVAIVTGAGRGIGRAVALALACQGADVVLAARTSGQIEEVASEVRGIGRQAIAIPTDVTNEEHVKALVARTITEFGRLNILVNNAGSGGRADVADLPLADWDRIVSTNATGTFLCARAVIPHMRLAGGGRIVNVVSGNGRQGAAGAAAYSASKFAVMGLSQSLALEVRDDNISVTCVLPGPTDTALRAASTPDEDKSLILHADDVAEVILFAVTRPDHVIISEIPVRPRLYMAGVA